MDEEKKETLDELEKAYKDISTTTSAHSAVSNLSDEKQKLSSMVTDIEKELGQKKQVVENKLGTLKNLKTEIEAGLEELKGLEAKKGKIKTELEKIDSIEKQEKDLEAEIANL